MQRVKSVVTLIQCTRFFLLHHFYQGVFRLIFQTADEKRIPRREIRRIGVWFLAYEGTLLPAQRQAEISSTRG